MSASRRSSAGKPGVFSRYDSKGRKVLEVWYFDTDGRRRWQVADVAALERVGLEPSGTKAGKKNGVVLIDDAVALREALNTSVRSGEYVPPSRASLREVANEWLDAQAGLREKTRRAYKWAFDKHIYPALGDRRVQDVTPDDVASLLASLQTAGYSPHTVRGVLTPLSRVLGHCARRRVITANPCLALDRSERPKLSRRRVRVLTRDEMTLLLRKTPSAYHAAIATAMFSGVRLGELLALRWSDIRFREGVIRVEWQVDSTGELVEPKTPQAKRDIILMPSLASVLKTHRAASRFSQDDHFVFASATGKPMDGRNVAQRGLRDAAVAAKLIAKPERKGTRRRTVGSVPKDGAEEPLTMHVLRHCFASLLIAQGEDVTFVSRQLGHANPAITLRVYAHLWDARRHASTARSRLEKSYGKVLDVEHGMEHETGDDGIPGDSGEPAKVLDLQAKRR